MHGAQREAAITAAQAVNNTAFLNAATLGRARVRLFTHNTAGAITDAQTIRACLSVGAGKLIAERGCPHPQQQTDQLLDFESLTLAS